MCRLHLAIGASAVPSPPQHPSQVLQYPSVSRICLPSTSSSSSLPPSQQHRLTFGFNNQKRRINVPLCNHSLLLHLLRHTMLLRSTLRDTTLRRSMRFSVNDRQITNTTSGSVLNNSSSRISYLLASYSKHAASLMHQQQASFTSVSSSSSSSHRPLITQQLQEHRSFHSTPTQSTPSHIAAAVTNSSTSTSTSSPASSSSSSSSSSTYKFLRPPRHFSTLIQQQVSEYARQPQQTVTIKQLLEVGSSPSKAAILQSAQFCHRELPIRLAKRVKELESLPYGLSQMAPVVKVRGWYEQSFRELLEHPYPTTEAEELSFTNLLESIYNRHQDVVPTLAQGVLQMKKELGASGADVVNQCPYLQDFLNRFHSSRIGIRLLISQHIALHQPVSGFIGTVSTNLSPMAVIRDAISDASRICDREYGWAPEVNVIGDENQVINFVPNHLHHIMFELMKNSMRAVLEFHGVKNYDAPAIEVVLTNDEERYAIKVSDQGGGIRRKDMPRIWSYLYTTNSHATEDLLAQVTNSSSSSSNNGGTVDAALGHPTNAVGPTQESTSIMSGFGYGLPISRLYAAYFGGDLNIISVEGYGTDAYLFLNKLGDHNLFLE